MEKNGIMKSRRKFYLRSRKSSLLDLKVKDYRDYINMYFGNSLPIYEKEFILKTNIESDLLESNIPLEIYTMDIFEN